MLRGAITVGPNAKPSTKTEMTKVAINVGCISKSIKIWGAPGADTNDAKGQEYLVSQNDGSSMILSNIREKSDKR